MSPLRGSQPRIASGPGSRSISSHPPSDLYPEQSLEKAQDHDQSWRTETHAYHRHHRRGTRPAERWHLCHSQPRRRRPQHPDGNRQRRASGQRAVRQRGPQAVPQGQQGQRRRRAQDCRVRSRGQHRPRAIQDRHRLSAR